MSKHAPLFQSSRRGFLRGLGAVAAASATPFMPSLVSDAQAQAHAYDRIIFVAWSHGVHAPLWQPTVPGFRDVGSGVRAASMSDASLGMYFGDHFDGLKHKITMLRGVGQVGATGHQTCVALTGTSRGPNDGYLLTSLGERSVDNVLAQSGRVYDAPPAVDVLRLSMTGLDETHSFIDQHWVPAVNADVAYAQLFSGGFPAPMEAPPSGPTAEERDARRRLVVVERSLAQHMRLRDSGRLSASDRTRLEQTMSQFAEMAESLRMRIDALASAPMASPTLGCSEFDIDGGDSGDAKMRDHVRLLTQGMACNRTRIGYWRMPSSHADVDGAHNAGSSACVAGHGLYTRIMRDNMRRVAALLRSMDEVVEGNGKTLLDNSLVVVTSDMATSVIGEHPGVDAPFLLAGGLGGKIRMGEFIDYADYGNMMRESHGHQWFAGPPHNELLISIMKSMGLSEGDWGGGGFGRYDCIGSTCGDPDPWVTQRKYVEYVRDVHSRAPGAELPYLRV